MQTNGAVRRLLASWIARATSSLPAPLSPLISTVAFVAATRSIWATMFFRPALEPIICHSSPSRRRNCSFSSADRASRVESTSRAARLSIARPRASQTAITNSRSSGVASRCWASTSRCNTPTAWPPCRMGAEMLATLPPPGVAAHASTASSVPRTAAITPGDTAADDHSAGTATVRAKSEAGPVSSRRACPACSPICSGSSTIPRAAPDPCMADSSANDATALRSLARPSENASRQSSAAARPTRGAVPAASRMSSSSRLLARRCVIEACHASSSAGISPVAVPPSSSASPVESASGSPEQATISTRPMATISPGTSSLSAETGSPPTSVPLRLLRSRIDQPDGAPKISA